MRTLILYCAIGAAALVPARSVHAASFPDAESVVNRIISSERTIRDMQAHVTCYIPENNNSVFFKWQWGYAGGKEFYEGELYTSGVVTVVNVDGNGRTYTTTKKEDGGIEYLKKAFDGTRAYMFRRHEGDASSGLIGAFDAAGFRGFLSPTELLGFDAKTNSRESLGEALLGADRLSLGENRIIDGHSCISVEAIGADRCPESGTVCDVRVWVDPNRGYRPLRFEKCFSIEGKNRWKLPIAVVDDIELRKIDGIWFPVKGTQRGYTISDIAPPEGMSEEEFSQLSLREKREQGQYTMRPVVKPRVLVVDQDSIALNRGISDEAFKIKFPKGCTVFDEFLQYGYKVGDNKDIGNSMSTIGDAHAFDATPLNTPAQEQSQEANIVVKASDASPERPSRRKTDAYIYYLAGAAGIAILAAVCHMLMRRLRTQKS